MKIVTLLEVSQLIEGTTCFNCTFTKEQKVEQISSKEINKQGGIDLPKGFDYELAKAVDVITMPGDKTVTTKKWCKNSLVNQWVTERMCCNYWDHEGLLQ